MFQQHQMEEGLKASSLHTAQKTFPAATSRKSQERAAPSPIEVRTRPAAHAHRVSTSCNLLVLSFVAGARLTSLLVCFWPIPL